MKKITILMAAVLLFSGLGQAVDFIIELKGQYFYPSEDAFRDIYGGGFMYG